MEFKCGLFNNPLSTTDFTWKIIIANIRKNASDKSVKMKD
jgi:hypothetical protein